MSRVGLIVGSGVGARSPQWLTPASDSHLIRPGKRTVTGAV